MASLQPLYEKVPIVSETFSANLKETNDNTYDRPVRRIISICHIINSCVRYICWIEKSLLSDEF